MIVTIDRLRCQGHGRCAAVAPALFHLNDDGFIENETIMVAEADHGTARRAIRACPEGIIREHIAGEPADTKGVVSNRIRPLPHPAPPSNATDGKDCRD